MTTEHLIDKLDKGHSAKVLIKAGKVECPELQELCSSQGYVDVIKKDDKYIFVDEMEHSNVYQITSVESLLNIVEKVYEYSVFDVDTENELQSVFLRCICNNIACGSQRCEREGIWLMGCRRYKDFLEDVHTIVAEMVD